MMIICDYCGRDIDALGQDNMSHVPFSAMCEDCHRGFAEPVETAPAWDTELCPRCGRNIRANFWDNCPYCGKVMTG